MLRELWRRRNVLLGAYCTLGNTFSAEIMARAGFDYIAIDEQHGLIGPDALVPMIQVITSSGTPALVRVPSNEPSCIMRALDVGADGVIVPLVNTAQDASRAVAAARYPPIGDRSWGPFRALLADQGYTTERGNAEALLIVQIESRTAVENIDAILDVPGLDGIYIGPNDLTLSNGPDANRDGTLVRGQIERALEAAHMRNMPAGIGCGGLVQPAEMLDLGFEMIMVDSDWTLLRKSATAAVQSVRDHQHNGAPASR